MTTQREATPRMTQQQWQALTAWPLNIAAIVFVVAYSFKVIGNDKHHEAFTLYLVMIVIWAIFVVNYVIMLVLARQQRWLWVRKNWYQIPITLLPALEPLRLLRLVELTDLLPNKTAGNRLRSRVGLYVVSILILVIYLGALMVLDAEQNAPGASITSFGDAVWWAVVTVTTVGYGDFVPITVQGRLVAAALMLSGVALIGTITGTLASFLGERSRAHDASRVAASAKQVNELAAQLAAMEARLTGGGAGQTNGESTAHGASTARDNSSTTHVDSTALGANDDDGTNADGGSKNVDGPNVGDAATTD